MRARLMDLFSPDIPELESWTPPNPQRFGFLVQMSIGAYEGDGEDLFDVVVCSPAWLADRMTDHELQSGRHHLFTKTYDWPRIEAYLRTRIESEDAETWEELASRLGRLGMWEFEDYREL